MKGYINKPRYTCITTGCAGETQDGDHYCFKCETRHNDFMVQRRKEPINIDEEGKKRDLVKNIKKKRYKKCWN